MSQIEWLGSSHPLTREQVAAVEAKWGVHFPDDYVGCAMANHGRYPLPHSFQLNHGREILNHLLSYDSERASYIVETYQNIQDRLVHGIYPFAADPGGNMICFDYRAGGAPHVVLWDHEQAFENPEEAIIPICNTFTELIGMLHTFEDDE